MAKFIKIAPDLEEIKVENRIISTDFNNTRIEYTMEEDYEPIETVKDIFRQSIAFSSKSWQIERMMENCGLKGKLKTTEI